MTQSRDDFPKHVRDKLAGRAGHRCSKPDCPRPTIGASLTDPDKIVVMGVAAHITAAAKGGPRYDESLTSEQRSSLDNGIWLCEWCGTLIDKDEKTYPTSLLRSWKEQREKKAAEALQETLPRPHGPALRFAPFSHIDRERQAKVAGSVLGLRYNTVILTGRDIVGVIANEGLQPATGLSVKVVLPSGRAIPLKPQESEINGGDTTEFTLCLVAGGRDGTEWLAMFGDEIVQRTATESLEVTVRVTTRTGERLEQRVELPPPGELSDEAKVREDLPLPVPAPKVALVTVNMDERAIERRGHQGWPVHVVRALVGNRDGTATAHGCTAAVVAVEQDGKREEAVPIPLSWEAGSSSADIARGADAWLVVARVQAKESPREFSYIRLGEGTQGWSPSAAGQPLTIMVRVSGTNFESAELRIPVEPGQCAFSGHAWMDEIHDPHEWGPQDF
jgi:hypothetical protein